MLRATYLCAAPSFYGDVLPVLEKNCQGCHRVGGIGPMPLLTYAQTRAWGRAIRESVLQRRMPPWHADPAVGHFKNDRHLQDAEIRLLTAWVDAGCPKGAVAVPLRGRAPETGWAIGKPDLIVTMPRATQVPATGQMDYVYFRVPLQLARDVWIEKAEARPGASAVVHHIDVFVLEPGATSWFTKIKPGVPYSPPPGKAPASRPADRDGGYWDTVEAELICGYLPGVPLTCSNPGKLANCVRVLN